MEARQGKLGKVCAVRYSLHAPNKPLEAISSHAKEALGWIAEVNGMQELTDIYGSANDEKTVWLVTCQFADGSVANLFLDFSGAGSTWIKQMEIAGTEGLYVFDSTVEQAFQSDFLQAQAIEPEEHVNRQAEEWWKLLGVSAALGEAVVLQKG